MKLVKASNGTTRIILSKKEWKEIGKTAGWIKKAQYARNENNPLNGKTKQSASNFIYKAVGDMTKGFFNDDSWKGVHDIFKKLDSLGIDSYIVDTKYYHDEEYTPIGKHFYIEIPFVDNKGADKVLQGTITAAGAGTVRDPLSRYDLAFVI